MTSNGSAPSSPKAIHHKKHDVYSENVPIPSIQRFFKRGLTEVVHHHDEDSEEEEESSSDDYHQEGAAAAVASAEAPTTTDEIARPPVNVEEKQGDDDEPTLEKPKRGKTRMVEDPITRTRVAIHDVGKREYNRVMNQADKDINNQGSSQHQQQQQHQRKPSTTGKAFSISSKDKRSSKEYKRSSRELKNSDTTATTSRSEGILNSHHHHKDPSNVLLLPFPDEIVLPSQLWRIHSLLLPSFVIWAILTIFRLIHPIASVFLMTWLAWWAYHTILVGVEDQRWEKERLRGKGAVKGYYNGYQESKEEKMGHTRPMDGVMEGAEWLNSILESLWSVLNSDLFSSLGSTLEDVLQASTNGQAFIQAVKVEDLSQGSTPLRLTGLRVLGDEEAYELRLAAQKEMKARHAKDKKVTLPNEQQEGKKGTAIIPNREDEEKAAQTKTKNTKNQKRQSSPSSSAAKEVDVDAGGNFINVELSFIYRARPSTNTVASKSRNAHLLIKFWVGARKWYRVPLPVWVEFKGLVGKVRARIQLTPDPPFIKNVTFAFMGLPRTEVTVIPLRINTQNIPFLSGFIQKSIDAAIGEYCAPSSLTIDVGEMLMGDNIKREVNALGVVIVIIHCAFDLEKQDVTGSSDPYCTISLKKNGKVQYCTRVALDDLSPRWEERCFLIITPEAVRAKEKVLISLWDSDRLSADDVLGQAEVDLQALVRRPGRLFKRTDTLVGLSKEMKKQGTIQWSLGFFAKVPNKKRWIDQESKEKEEKEVEKVKRQEADIVDIDETIVEQDVHKLDKEEDVKEFTLLEDDSVRQTRNTEQAVSFEPPSQAMPTGILALQIHQIAQLEMIDTKTHISSRKSADTAQKMEEALEDEQDHAASPSSYVTIILNDETIFRSRIKSLNSNPFFNAGTERLITDWTRTLVMFVIWDSRLREEDAILGVVPLKLTDVFTSTSQVTQFFPIAGGVGQGRIRLSLLFRPLQGTMKRREKLGWNIGTMRIQSSLLAFQFTHHFNSTILRLVSIRFSTIAGKAYISSRRCSLTDKGGGGGGGGESSQSVEWHLNKDEFPFKVPVRRRYAAPFIIEFRGISSPLGTRKTVAMSIVWMQDLPDDDIITEDLPIWQANHGHDYHRLVQNYHNFRQESEAENLGVHRVGYLHVSLQFKSGAGQAHVKFGKRNPDVKAVMDAWACCTAAGLRNIRGDFAEKRHTVMMMMMMMTFDLPK